MGTSTGGLEGREMSGGRGQADLDGGHINRAIGNCDEEGEQVLGGRLVQGEVALVLAHHHHQHLPAYHHCPLRHCNSLIIKFYLPSYCCACSKSNHHCCQVSCQSVLVTDARSPSAYSQHLSQFMTAEYDTQRVSDLLVRAV